MPGDQRPQPPDDADPATAADQVESAARRRRLADVFGDVLPEVTEDDAPEEATRGDQSADLAERWYRENRPPHHGQR